MESIVCRLSFLIMSFVLGSSIVVAEPDYNLEQTLPVAMEQGSSTTDIEATMLGDSASEISDSVIKKQNPTIDDDLLEEVLIAAEITQHISTKHSAALADAIKKTARKTKPKSTQEKVEDTVKHLHELSGQKYSVDDENELNNILEEQEKLIGDLLKILRQSETTRLISPVDRKKVSFLKSRVDINQERGNTLALQRDQIALAYYQTVDKIRNYLQYLVFASRTYKTINEVVNNSIDVLALTKKEASTIVLPKVELESNIYVELEKNYHRYQYANSVFQGILDYVISNPTEIVKAHWFQKFSLVSVIVKINNWDLIRPLNYRLAPFDIDVGGVGVSLVIILLIVFCYLPFLKISSWLIDRIILHQMPDHTALILQELNKPLKFLVLFFSVDMATYALLYKTEYKPSLDNIEFVVYAGVGVWILYKLLDIIFIIQFERMAKSKKDLRKELINLGIQFAKGIIFIVILSLVLNQFGISITAIVSTLGIGGLAFALAAKDTLSNLFGGITILIDNVFRMGDWVTIGNDEGTIAEIGLRSTTIRTFDNALITIPNSVVSVSSVKNWNRRAVGRRIKMYIGVTYESNMDDLRQALVDIKTMLGEHPDISNPKEKYGSQHPRFKLSSREDTHGIKSTQLVFLDRYSDFSIDIMIYCFSKTVMWDEWLRVKEDVLFKIADILKKNNLEFAYPTEVRINRVMPADNNPDLLISE